MDIDEKINEIIFKYDLDEYYPRYRMMKKAEELIHELIEEWSQDEEVALIVAEDSEYWKTTGRHIQKVISSSCCKAKIDILSCYRKDGKSEYAEFYDTAELCNIKRKRYDRIIVASWEGEEFICDWLTHNVSTNKVFYLYDYFISNGLIFEDEYYNYIHDQARPWIADTKDYKLSTSPIIFEINRQAFKKRNTSNEMMCILSKKMFFLALVMRNFVYAERIYRELIVENVNDRYIKAWNEVEVVLNDVRKILFNREKDDILMFWLDGVSCNEASCMKNLKERIDAGIQFENMFGVSYFTEPEVKAFFCKKTLDDSSWNIRHIDSDNSPIISSLQNLDYKIFFMSGYLFGLEKEFGTDKCYYSNQPISTLLWDVIRQLILNGNRHCFILSHIFQESHIVWISSKMKRNAVAMYRDEGLEEIDEQIGYYSDFLPKSAIEIYMSDHGSTMDCLRSHTFMGICKKNNKPARLHSLCSHIDFPEILNRLLYGKEITDEILGRDYVKTVSQPVYNVKVIFRIFELRKHIKHMGFGEPIITYGYQSIITLDYIYVHYDYGRELLYRRDKPLPPLAWYKRDEDICDSSLLPEFRKLVSEKDFAPANDPKFRYAHYLPEVIRRAMPRNLEKIDCINRMVSEFPDGSVALRMGGEYGCQLYYALRKVNRRKISCIIDNNLKCKCAAFGIPVVSQKDADMSHLRAVILCSRQHIDELKEEAKNFPDHVKVLVVEEYLVKNRLDFKYEFWFFEPSEEDWDVGFPFDEVE